MSIMARQPRCLLHGGSIETSQEECSLCRDLATLTVPPRTITKEEEAVIAAALEFLCLQAHAQTSMEMFGLSTSERSALEKILDGFRATFSARKAPKEK